MLWDAAHSYSNVIDGKTYVNQNEVYLNKYASRKLLLQLLLFQQSTTA